MREAGSAMTECSDWIAKIVELMDLGSYAQAAEEVLQLAERISNDAGNERTEARVTQLRRADSIASTYGNLMWLAANKPLANAHKARTAYNQEAAQKRRRFSVLSNEIYEQIANFLDEFNELKELFEPRMSKYYIFCIDAINLNQFIKKEESSLEKVIQSTTNLLSIMNTWPIPLYETPGTGKRYILERRRPLIRQQADKIRSHCNELIEFSRSDLSAMSYQQLTSTPPEVHNTVSYVFEVLYAQN